MSQKDALTAELKSEAANTRKMLEKIPPGKFDWQPHGKSMTIGRLASHVAEIPVWVNRIVESAVFDFATASMVRNTYGDTAALLKVFEEKQAGALAALQNVTEGMLQEKFTLRRGEQVITELPRQVLLRNFAFNHLVHHRGQLSVYLRLLDIAVPGMYGPSADEK
jgi:uncharacterized damage-inducible protein DinB